MRRSGQSKAHYAAYFGAYTVRCRVPVRPWLAGLAYACASKRRPRHRCERRDDAVPQISPRAVKRKVRLPVPPYLFSFKCERSFDAADRGRKPKLLKDEPRAGLPPSGRSELATPAAHPGAATAFLCSPRDAECRVDNPPQSALIDSSSVVRLNG